MVADPAWTRRECEGRVGRRLFRRLARGFSMRLRFDSLIPDVRSLPPILVILSRTMTSDSPTKASDDKFLTLTSSTAMRGGFGSHWSFSSKALPLTRAPAPCGSRSKLLSCHLQMSHRLQRHDCIGPPDSKNALTVQHQTQLTVQTQTIHFDEDLNPR
jgi:hypothetical protein